MFQCGVVVVLGGVVLPNGGTSSSTTVGLCPGLNTPQAAQCRVLDVLCSLS